MLCEKKTVKSCKKYSHEQAADYTIPILELNLN